MTLTQWFSKLRQGAQDSAQADSQMNKEILISMEANEKRVAILEDKVVEEFYIERADAERLLGNIYKGKVKSLVPGIGAAFIDLGTKRDGFLFVGDAVKSPADFDAIDLEETGKRQIKETEAKIQDILKLGQELVVQVVKEPIRNKGPRLTIKFTIPARYLVLIPGEKRIGISRRIEAAAERERLRKIFGELEVPEDAGFIVRTAGEGKSRREFARDIHYLIRQWGRLKAKIETAKPPALVHQELDLVERTIRDSLTEDTKRIVVDNLEIFRNVKRFLRTYLPRSRFRAELYRGRIPLFEKYHVEKEIEKAFQKNLALKSGGYIVIEQTEGMVSIDVNTGRFRGKDNIQDTVYRTNLEASEEIARQLRLRDVGGIIVIDFIDMEKESHRRNVLRTFREAVRRDRARTNILQLSELGLVEMTRQRVRPSLESAVYDSCPYCEGKGVVKSPTTMSIQVLKRIRRIIYNSREKTFNVSVHPSVAEHLVKRDFKSLQNIERQTHNKIIILADANLHMEDINIEESKT